MGRGEASKVTAERQTKPELMMVREGGVFVRCFRSSFSGMTSFETYDAHFEDYTGISVH
jgi:hypothetical protein